MFRTVTIRRFFVAAALVSCAAPNQSAPTPAGEGMAWSTMQDANPPGQQATKDGTSAIDIKIKWPSQTVQLLPGSTYKIVLTVKSGDVAMPPPLEVLRPTTTGSFEHLPVGTVTLSAVAKNSDDLAIANGSITITLQSNKRAAATLTMTPSNGPTISNFSPKAAGPDAVVTLTGSRFDTDFNKASIMVGGIAVPKLNLVTINENEYQFRVPAGATTSVVSITVDGVTTSTALPFTTLGSLAIAPLSAQATIGSNTVFTVTALDTLFPPGAVSGAEVNWMLTDQRNINRVLLPTPAPTPTPMPTPSPAPTPTPTSTPEPNLQTPIPALPTPTPVPGPTGGAIGIIGDGKYVPQLGAFTNVGRATDLQGTATATFVGQATGSAFVNVTSGKLIATASIQIQ